MGATAAAAASFSGHLKIRGDQHPAAEYIPPRRKLSPAVLPVGLWSAQAAPARLLPDVPR